MTSQFDCPFRLCRFKQRMDEALPLAASAVDVTLHHNLVSFVIAPLM